MTGPQAVFYFTLCGALGVIGAIALLWFVRN
jgi:hypothetical protein